MNRKDYEAYPLIRLHEQMHVFYGHSWDSLWMQLLQVFHWFNPVVWLWQKELRDLHEYQADHGVISCGIDVKTYQLLLVEKAVGTRLYSMACGFDHCSLKKRITMMMERKTPGYLRICHLQYPVKLCDNYEFCSDVGLYRGWVSTLSGNPISGVCV